MTTPDSFTLLDYRKHLAGVLKPGLLARMTNWLTGTDKILKGIEGDRTCHQQLGIVDAMTPEERAFPERITRQRARRIAHGAGVHPHAVHQLLKMHETMRQMLEKMRKNSPRGSGGPGPRLSDSQWD